MNTQQQCTEDPPLLHTYKYGPLDRANGRAKQANLRKLHKDPPVSVPEEDVPGVYPGSAEPRQVPIQVRFDVESPPSLLIIDYKVSIPGDGGN